MQGAYLYGSLILLKGYISILDPYSWIVLLLFTEFKQLVPQAVFYYTYIVYVFYSFVFKLRFTSDL